MWLMPSKHWSVRPSGDLCLVQKLVEIAHTDEDGIVHEQTAIAARSMTGRSSTDCLGVYS
jgi:hypothetical protein